MKLPSFSFSMISWPSAWVAENLGIAPLGPKQFLRNRVDFGWIYLELRAAWPRTAAAVPEAKSRTPAVGLANVPKTPLPRPVMNPCKKKTTLKILRRRGPVYNVFQFTTLDRHMFATGSKSADHCLDLLSGIPKMNSCMLCHLVMWFGGYVNPVEVHVKKTTYRHSRVMRALVGLCHETSKTTN